MVKGRVAKPSTFVQPLSLAAACRGPLSSKLRTSSDSTTIAMSTLSQARPTFQHQHPPPSNGTVAVLAKRWRGRTRARSTLGAAANDWLPEASSSVAASSVAAEAGARSGAGARAGTQAGVGASLAGGTNGHEIERNYSPGPSSTSRRRTKTITDARFRRRVGDTRTSNPTLQKQKDYLHLIKAAGVRGAWREVAVLVREMGGKGVKGNVYIYNTAIAAFARCGRPAEAEALLTTMLSRDVAPDTISYNSAINGYARRGDLDAARRLLLRMTELGSMGELVKPDQFTYNSVANAAAKRGDAAAAAETLKVMTQAGVTPTLITYNSCLAACKSKGDLRRAVVLLELMKEDGINPDQRSYSAAIATAGK